MANTDRLLTVELEPPTFYCHFCGDEKCGGECQDRLGVFEEIEPEPQCFTCGATDRPLDSSWGPFCIGTDCRAIADREADRAADARYI